MTKISAAQVKALRDRTGLPFMDCKKALEETGGDEEKAIEWLRKAGKKAIAKLADRETSCGRIGIFADRNLGRGAMVELFCETPMVAINELFVNLANQLAKQLATGPGASSADELLDQKFVDDPQRTMRDLYDETNNRIREAFRIGRLVRVEGPCTGYVHHDGKIAVLLEAEGGDEELAKYICMHIAAMAPAALSPDELDPAMVEKEKEILAEQTRKEGKPDHIIEKIVQGRLRAFFAEKCLLEQPLALGPSANQPVGKVAQQAGMTIKGFLRWVLGEQ